MKKPSAPAPQTPRRVWLLRVVFLYLAGVLVYSLLACLLRNAPNIVIDESLYTNIARSLAWDGQIAYRAQPVDYPYILYPLLLVPVYRLQALLGGDIYRWVQIFNAFLIGSSVFPVFLLGSDYTRDDRRGFLAAALTLLTADMLMCALEMTESLIWPLSLWAVYFAWRMISGEKVRDGVLTGLFTGLVFFTKPGAAAMGAVILLAALIGAARRKKSVKPALAGLLTLLGVICLVYVQYVVLFGSEFSLLGLYSKQTSDWQLSHVFAAGLGFVEMILAFGMAGAVVFVLLPYFARKEYDEPQRRMLWVSTAGLLAVLLGTAIFVIPYQWDGNFAALPVHMRYAAMYLPVWIIFTLAVGTEKVRLAKGLSAAMILGSLASLALGILMAVSSSEQSSADKLSLAAFSHSSSFNGTVTGVLLAIAIACFGLWFAMYTQKRYDGRIRKAALVMLGLTLVFNTVCGAVSVSLGVDSDQPEDAEELNELIRDEPALLGVTQRDYADILSYRQEAHLSRPLQQVTIDQMISSMLETGGVYESFTPMDQSPNIGDGPTPESPVLVLGQTIAEHLTLSDSVRTVTTSHDLYTLVYLTPGERWVDSMMYGMAENVLLSGTEGAVCFFDPDAVGRVLKMDVSSAVETTLTFTQNGSSVSRTFTGSTVIEIPVESDWIGVTADQSLYVYGYTVE